jgi:uncharacterized protein (TIGR03083 family)
MINFDEVIAANSTRFRSVLAEVPDGARVPSCPDWSAADLLWHLSEVQGFWGSIVAQRLQTDAEVGAVVAPDRPASRADALALFERVSFQLGMALETAADADPVWTWSGVNTVGWVRRRQAHEALIHRVDAELTAGVGSSLDPELAEDGIDELLTQFGSGPPEWGEFDPSGLLIEVRSTFSQRTWRVRLGLFRGVDPAGTRHEEPDFAPAGETATPVDATIEGPAADLLLWLWGRGEDAGIAAAGDPVACQALRRAVVANTQ